MMLLIDLLLFAAPFLLYALGRGLTPMLSRAALLAACAAVALIAMAGAWYARQDRLAPGEVYAPARLEGGRILPGHGTPGR